MKRVMRWIAIGLLALSALTMVLADVVMAGQADAAAVVAAREHAGRAIPGIVAAGQLRME